jgi:hypothetical protein
MDHGHKCDVCGKIAFPGDQLSLNGWRRIEIKEYAFFILNRTQLESHVCSKECAADILRRFVDLMMAEGDRSDFAPFAQAKLFNRKYP